MCRGIILHVLEVYKCMSNIHLSFRFIITQEFMYTESESTNFTPGIICKFKISTTRYGCGYSIRYVVLFRLRHLSMKIAQLASVMRIMVPVPQATAILGASTCPTGMPRQAFQKRKVLVVL